jgi:hypothetical protein
LGQEKAAISYFAVFWQHLLQGESNFLVGRFANRPLVFGQIFNTGQTRPDRGRDYNRGRGRYRNRNRRIKDGILGIDPDPDPDFDFDFDFDYQPLFVGTIFEGAG